MVSMNIFKNIYKNAFATYPKIILFFGWQIGTNEQDIQWSNSSVMQWSNGENIEW
jgi:hypothetical protein